MIQSWILRGITWSCLGGLGILISSLPFHQEFCFFLVPCLSFFNQNQCFLASISDLSAVLFRHEVPQDSQEDPCILCHLLCLSSLLMMAAIVSVTSLHKGAYWIVFAVLIFNGSKELTNASCSVQHITLSFHCGIVGRR